MLRAPRSRSTRRLFITTRFVTTLFATTTAQLTRRRTLAGFATVAALATSPAAANPLGGNVVGGSATIQGQGTSAVTVNQSTQNAIINWSTFNIGQGETTTFNQPNSASVMLNRVVGAQGLGPQGPSFLDGTLSANGRVFIVNGDGIWFGPHSSISTSGFLATTSDIQNADFMAGKYNFNIPGNPSASIVNQGSINAYGTATTNGFAALVAPGVRNSGTITATLGTVNVPGHNAVGLAAGNAFTLDFYGDRLITLALNDQIASQVIDVATGRPLNSLVGNSRSGMLVADGGRVELTAAAAAAVVHSVINNEGVIEANSVGAKNGMIVLSAATAESKPAGAPAQTIRLSGKISAAGKDKGTKGGTVVVSGEHIRLADAQIDASGDAGGGHVLIGGDTGGGHLSAAAASIELARLESFIIPTASTVTVDAASVINASATHSGNGGKVVLWSNEQTKFAGTILAQGGAAGGNGGFVETSSHFVNFTGAQVNTSAPIGTIGTWLVDPTDLTIDSAAAATISSNLATTSVTVSTNADGSTSGPGVPNTDGAGDIYVNAGISWSSGSTLTLSAYRNISFNEAGSISNSGAGSLILRADNAGSGNGTVRFFGGRVDFRNSTGTVSIYYSPTAPTDCDICATKYQNPTSYSRFVLTQSPSQLTAYMLVNSAADLTVLGNSAIDGMISGNFALGRNIDATGFTGMADTTFNGLFDGNGGLDVNSTIDKLTLSLANSQDSMGLFPFIGSSGVVRNLNLSNVTITAGANIQLIGALAGTNQGTISNVNVLTGTISGGTYWGIGGGGLVGQNSPNGTISNSSANVTVTVGNATSSSNLNIAGGLVATNLGSIANSSASGNVSGGGFSVVGGFVGQNGLSCDCVPSGPGNITSSFATGNVSGSGNVQLGGFVGVNDTGSTIQNASATGTVAGANLVSDGGGGTASVGGFAGINNGTISNSYAAADTSGSGANFGDFLIGGFVGTNNNSGTIQGTNPGQFSFATGNVTGGANSIAGGFVGENSGSITFAYASGNVHVGSNSYAGGFVAGNGPFGTIFQAFASGTVRDDGNSVLGGFGAFNLGSLNQVFATGGVIGGTNTLVAGLVAVNAAVANCNSCDGLTVGSITNAYATSQTSGGSNSITAGLVAINDGGITSTYSTGAVAGGSTGGLVAQNNSSFQFANLNIPNIVNNDGSPAPLVSGNGAVTNSYWNTQTSGQNTSAGGTGMTSQQLASGLPAGFNSTVWTIQPDPSFPYFPWSPIIPTVNFPPAGPGTSSITNPPSQPQIIDNLTNNLVLVSLPPPVNVLPYPPPPPGQLFNPGQGPQLFFGPRLIAVPPRGETRFVKDEVLLMVDSNTPQAVIEQVARELNLAILDTISLTQAHVNLLRLHINGGRTVAAVIGELARYQVVAVAQANFIYLLMQGQGGQQPAPQEPAPQEPAQQGPAQDPDLAGHTQEGDAAQYALGKLGLFDIHQQIKGSNISIAVIDSQVDIHHPDLEGVFADQYNAVGTDEKAHPHGTGMAGAIAAHRKLMGIAPAARIYAVHAFSSSAASADSTTFNILKGMDWAVSKGVRVINMSFAGPRDPSMERSLKAAHDKGIVLIAAAGNAGPKSPPLYPGADPDVIAVTATDVDDKVFSGANRGKYIAVAAPGVDILVPAPEDTYQLTTGTSVSSAEVSGIVALLLERNPNLTPEDIRKILTNSAKHPGAKERDDDFGSGLVDPSKAIQDAAALRPAGQPAKR